MMSKDSMGFLLLVTFIVVRLCLTILILYFSMILVNSCHKESHFKRLLFHFGTQKEFG